MVFFPAIFSAVRLHGCPVSLGEYGDVMAELIKMRNEARMGSLEESSEKANGVLGSTRTQKLL